MHFRRINMKTLFFAFLSAAVLAVAVAGAAATLSSDDISGKYTGVAKSDSIGEIPVTMILKNADGKITGSLDSPQGQGELRDGTVSKGKFNCVLDFNGDVGSISATVDGGKITGTWDVAGLSGTIEVKKVVAKPAAASSR